VIATAIRFQEEAIARGISPPCMELNLLWLAAEDPCYLESAKSFSRLLDLQVASDRCAGSGYSGLIRKWCSVTARGNDACVWRCGLHQGGSGYSSIHACENAGWGSTLAVAVPTALSVLAGVFVLGLCAMSSRVPAGVDGALDPNSTRDEPRIGPVPSHMRFDPREVINDVQEQASGEGNPSRSAKEKQVSK